MTCDTVLRPRQTIQERAAEVKKAAAGLDKALVQGRVKVVVDKRTGAIAFAGFNEPDRAGITDACAYRRIMATGSASAKAAIARAELLAGRGVNRTALAQGVHSHDGGGHFHPGHKH